MPPEALAYAMADPQWCLREAENVGPNCKGVIDALFADRVLDNLRAAQGIIGLGQRFGQNRLEAACRRALAFANPRYRAVKTILEKGLDQLPCQETAFDFLSEAYTGHGRFSRNPSSLLDH
jgi:hypothetical protein